MSQREARAVDNSRVETAMDQATNKDGKKVNLPAAPKREAFETEAAYLEAKKGWDRRVGPLLNLRRGKSAPNP